MVNGVVFLIDAAVIGVVMLGLRRSIALYEEATNASDRMRCVMLLVRSFGLILLDAILAQCAPHRALANLIAVVYAVYLLWAPEKSK